MLYLRENATLFSVLIKPEVINSGRDSMKDYIFKLMQVSVRKGGFKRRQRHSSVGDFEKISVKKE